MKIRKILILILGVFLLTGCNPKVKTKITGDEFKEKLKDRYTISDVTNQTGYAKSAYQINEQGVFIFYIEGNRTTDIEGLYLDEVQNITTGLGTEFSDEVTNGENWVMVQATNDDSYYRITKIDNTFIFGNIEASKRKTLDNIFKELGY